jgi:uncharacterized protein (DUF1330 family)
MSLPRSLFIAAGAGIAGLSLGLILADAGGPCEAQASFYDGQAPETGAYMIVLGTVHDRQAFMSQYASQLAPLYERHGGSYVAVSGNVETLEGDTPFESVVMSRWPDRQSARDFWNDPEYRELADLRIENAWGDFNVVVVDALPQQRASAAE